MLKPEIKAQWLTALRSGEYAQGQGKLTTIGQEGRRDCCLGVLCDLAVKAGLPVIVTRDLGIVAYDGCEGLVPPSVWTWSTGIEAESSINEFDFNIKVHNPDYDPENAYTTPEVSSTLSEQNDAGDDFDVIAGYIEAQL